MVALDRQLSDVPAQAMAHNEFQRAMNLGIAILLHMTADDLVRRGVGL